MMQRRFLSPSRDAYFSNLGNLCLGMELHCLKHDSIAYDVDKVNSDDILVNSS